MINRIAEVRAQKGLTLTEVAKRAKTTPAQIQKLERGHRRLTVDWMRRLSVALDVGMAELLPSKRGGKAKPLPSTRRLPGSTGDIEQKTAELTDLLNAWRLKSSKRRTQKKDSLEAPETPVATARLIRLARELALVLEMRARVRGRASRSARRKG